MGLYHRLPIASHRRSGSMNLVKRKGGSVFPWSVPRKMESGAVLLGMVM